MVTSGPSGILLIDKPAGITSFDIIRRLRAQTGLRKFGHAGTLDPAATGLMVILVGAATKQAATLTGLNKTYLATVTLGSNSSTGDIEGILTPVSNHRPSDSEIEAILSRFVGEITQVPSAYSAIKINGQEAYKRIRRGEKFVMPSRQVKIRTLKLLNYTYPTLLLEADVSSGTYIRSLAADIGASLSTGAYLSDLQRTIIGPYNLADAVALDQIDAANINNYLMKIGQT